MRLFFNLLGRNHRPARYARNRKTARRFEVFEKRNLMAGDALPVLMVIADDHDFYYQEYNDTRQSLEVAGLEVQVAATTTNPSTPHWNSGQGWEDGGVVVPDLSLAAVNSGDYSAIVFVGGWGASMYQYAFPGDYANDHYDGDLATKGVVNGLINDFLAQDKFVAAICHATSILAWARDANGNSPIEGHQVSVPYVGSPAVFYEGMWYGDTQLGQYEQAVANGAVANTASGQYGDPTTVTDDAIKSGQIITAENWDAALYFGQLIAQEVIAAAENDVTPVENQSPVASDDAWIIDEHSAAGTLVGAVAAVDPDPGQTLTYALVGGNVGNAFAIDAATGEITVSNAQALDFETVPEFQLTVEVTDNGDAPLSDTATITVTLLDVVEPPPASVFVFGDDLIVQATSGPDEIYIWSGGEARKVFVWMNGVFYGSHTLAPAGMTVVYGGDGNDRIFATDARHPVAIYGEGGHDLITGGLANDLLDGGDGVDRISGGPGDDLIRGGAGSDCVYGGAGNDVLLGGAGDDTLDGEAGLDLLIGGLGRDTVRGGAGEDLLIGGAWRFDNDDSLLAALRDAWVGPGDSHERETPQALGVGLQIQFAWEENVIDDGEKDTLWGGADADLLFASLGDDEYLGADDFSW